ncbi:uncharacterized protein LOC117112145 [Anneissia japonica]|uniref:uncharacterized protein LOC117112145 n=1 Tax=Anneissia japonica TaxID=1529436 RepID=UPI0014255CBA|nr:uncharacterized protein LOC117112145 [Anneissia japonica]
MDVWDEYADAPAGDWGKMTDARFKAGYAEGIVKGEQETVQEGFNTGFQQASLSGIPKGFLQGVLSAISTSEQLYGTLPFEDRTKLASLLEKANERLLQTKQLEADEKRLSNKKDLFDKLTNKDETCKNFEACDGDCSCSKPTTDEYINKTVDLDIELVKSILEVMKVEQNDWPTFCHQ